MVQSSGAVLAIPHRLQQTDPEVNKYRLGRVAQWVERRTQTPRVLRLQLGMWEILAWANDQSARWLLSRLLAVNDHDHCLTKSHKASLDAKCA